MSNGGEKEAIIGIISNPGFFRHLTKLDVTKKPVVALFRKGIKKKKKENLIFYLVTLADAQKVVVDDTGAHT